MSVLFTICAVAHALFTVSRSVSLILTLLPCDVLLFGQSPGSSLSRDRRVSRPFPLVRGSRRSLWGLWPLWAEAVLHSSRTDSRPAQPPHRGEPSTAACSLAQEDGVRCWPSALWPGLPREAWFPPWELSLLPRTSCVCRENEKQWEVQEDWRLLVFRRRPLGDTDDRRCDFHLVVE